MSMENHEAATSARCKEIVLLISYICIYLGLWGH